MHTIDLSPGQVADSHFDRIIIERRPHGAYGFQAIVAPAGEGQAAFGTGGPYATRDEARQAGISWAEIYGGDTLYVQSPAA